MSQVDYLHFFNNIVWTLIQIVIAYIVISVFFVQGFYKILRLRLLVYKFVGITTKIKDLCIINIIKFCSDLKNYLLNDIKLYFVSNDFNSYNNKKKKS